MITIKRRADMCKSEFAMLTSAMLRRLLIAVAALSISSFFTAEGFEMAPFENQTAPWNHKRLIRLNFPSDRH
jgi:hypothetical protein